jgi:hypothetical protein
MKPSDPSGRNDVPHPPLASVVIGRLNHTPGSTLVAATRSNHCAVVGWSVVVQARAVQGRGCRRYPHGNISLGAGQGRDPGAGDISGQRRRGRRRRTNWRNSSDPP